MRTSFLAFTFAILPFAAAQQKISTSARCGADFGGLTCKGSKFGDCCSQYSYWYVASFFAVVSLRRVLIPNTSGSTKAYCGSGCQAGFGKCNGASAPVSSSRVVSLSSSTRSSSLAASPTQKLTTNARCGKNGNGQTCRGSKWGSCCSQYSYVSRILAADKYMYEWWLISVLNSVEVPRNTAERDARRYLEIVPPSQPHRPG